MDGRALFGLIFYGHCIQGATTFWPHSYICNAIYHILLGRAKSTRTRAQAHVVSLRHLLYAPERDRFMLLYEHIICRSYRVACLTQPSNDRKSDNFSTYEKHTTNKHIEPNPVCKTKKSGIDSAFFDTVPCFQRLPESYRACVSGKI